MANPQNYRANSQFPMPSQVGTYSATVTVPDNVSISAQGRATYYTDITIDSDCTFYRTNITSSLADKTVVGNSFRVITASSQPDTVAFISRTSATNLRCFVWCRAGSSAATTVGQTFTFNVIGFKVQ